MTLREIRPDDGSPSCHVCGAIMVPEGKGFKCVCCGATTEPTEPAPSVVESQRMKHKATCTDFWTHKKADCPCGLEPFESVIARFDWRQCAGRFLLSHGFTMQSEPVSIGEVQDYLESFGREMLSAIVREKEHYKKIAATPPQPYSKPILENRIADLERQLAEAAPPLVGPQRWIPVSERLPEIGTWNAIALTGGMVVADFRGGLPYSKYVTHWQPLPAPPGAEVSLAVEPQLSAYEWLVKNFVCCECQHHQITRRIKTFREADNLGVFYTKSGKRMELNELLEAYASSSRAAKPDHVRDATEGMGENVKR